MANISMKVPFLDLKSQYTSIKAQIDEAINRVIQNSSFVRGEEVERFEIEFAELMGVEHCVSCANGTDAIFIAMKCLGLKYGDEVIVPANSWISASESVSLAGGVPVFCDVDPITYTLNPTQIQKKITSKTVGIIPVHLYGQPADMTAIMGAAKLNKLWVVEDCAQAHLAMHRDKKVGSYGNVATFSFYPSKNLGAMGDAGAILTSDSDLAVAMAKFARHGGLFKGQHLIEGINSRLDGMQAAILRVKMRHLKNWTGRRVAIGKIYSEQLPQNPNLVLPEVRFGDSHVWHLYVIRSKNRDLLRNNLSEAGIETIINYPVALPYLPAHKHLNHQPSDFMVSIGYQSEILSIPLYPELNEDQIQYVIDKISTYIAKV